MKRNLHVAAWILAILVFTSSCGKKSGNTGLLVPEDAAIVVHVNNASLSSKLSWDEIKQSNWFKEITKKTTDTLAQQLIADPSVTGVDPKSDFVFFFKKQGDGAYFVFQGALKDAKAYGDYVSKISHGAAQNKNGDITSVIMHKSMVLNWTSSHFILIGDAPMPDISGMKRRHFDEDGDGGGISRFSTDSLAYFTKGLFTLKNDDKLDNDDRFVSMVKDGKDIHLWMNSGLYYKGMMGPMMSMMGNISSLLDGNVSASSFNFDNGKITMDSKQYYGKQLLNLISKYKAKPVTSEMLGRIPSQNVIAALAINYPPEAIKELISLTGFEGMANTAMAKMNYSLDELVKASNGEMIVALTDLVTKQKLDTFTMNGKVRVDTSSHPDAKVIFATSVNDQPSFEKLITLIWEQSKGALDKSGTVTYKIENKWFAIGNSSDQVNQFLAGGNSKPAYAEKITGHPVGFFVDLQKIFNVAATDAKSAEAKNGLAAAMKTWQDVTAYGGTLKDKAVEFHAEINMVDKNTNSLKQLNTFIDEMYKTYQSRIDKMKDWQADISDSAGVKTEDIKIEAPKE